MLRARPNAVDEIMFIVRIRTRGFNNLRLGRFSQHESLPAFEITKRRTSASESECRPADRKRFFADVKFLASGRAQTRWTHCSRTRRVGQRRSYCADRCLRSIFRSSFRLVRIRFGRLKNTDRPAQCCVPVDDSSSITHF